MKHKKITKTERELLNQWKSEGLSNIECAKRLGRSKATIGRELTRNKTRVNVGKNDWQIIYEPLHAHSVAMDRKQKAFAAKHPLKNPDIYSYVLDNLRGDWFPEQISGRLMEQDHPGESHWQICMGTIYQLIYKEKTDQTKQGLKQSRILDKRLPDGKACITVTDYDCPLWEFLRRKQFGHWEGDSIVGRNHTSGLHTKYERISSLIMDRSTQNMVSLEHKHILQIHMLHGREVVMKTVICGLDTTSQRAPTLKHHRKYLAATLKDLRGCISF